MHLMQSISGLIPYHVILKACQSMNLHTSSRPRKNANKCVKPMKLRRGKRHNILNHMAVCLQFNKQDNPILKSDQASR